MEFITYEIAQNHQANSTHKSNSKIWHNRFLKIKYEIALLHIHNCPKLGNIGM